MTPQSLVDRTLLLPVAVSMPMGGAGGGTWLHGTHHMAQLDGPVTFGPRPVQMTRASFGPLHFAAPGVDHDGCSLHEGMLGTITVVDPSSVPPGE